MGYFTFTYEWDILGRNNSFTKQVILTSFPGHPCGSSSRWLVPKVSAPLVEARSAYQPRSTPCMVYSICLPIGFGCSISMVNGSKTYQHFPVRVLFLNPKLDGVFL